MIEITHQNARRLIHKELHAALHGEDWSRLETHLELCSECREYRSRLRGFETGLRRSLRSAFETAQLPRNVTALTVLARWQQRGRTRRRVAAGLGVLAVLLIFITAGGPAWAAGLFSSNRAPVPAADSLLQDLASVPTPAPGEFSAVLAFEARRNGASGDAEIYLYNPGAEPVSLSDHPANDSAPAWSPDGEWVAFLSDRVAMPGQPAKNEVWVTPVTGGRAVQLSAEPGITWQEPLSWSPDGRWIALTGRREQQGGQSWVYLVGLDGTSPRALMGTRGAWSPKFSPVDPNRLAFLFTSGDEVGLRVNLLDSGLSQRNDWQANPLAASPYGGAGFDWSFDGASLAYIAASTLQNSGSEVLAARGMRQTESRFFNFDESRIVAQSRWSSAFRAVSWSPDGMVAYLEAQSDARARGSSTMIADECWQLRMRETDPHAAQTGRVFTAGDLCVEGGFDTGSWTSDGRWLVVPGRRPGESQRALYAVRVPGRLDSAQEGESNGSGPAVLRLAGDPGTLHPPRVRPALDPDAAPLSIDPRPVPGTRADLPPSDLSTREGGPSGRLVYAVQNNTMSVVVSTNPDGTGGKVLYASHGRNVCPRWSPDGRQIAWVSSASRKTPAVAGTGEAPGEPTHPVRAGDEALTNPEVYALALDGGSPRQISDVNLLPEAGPQPLEATYDCPVWSPENAPGGPYVAVVMSTARGSSLAVQPVNGGVMRFAHVGTPAPGARPVWSQDGRVIFLAQYPVHGETPQVGAVTLPEDPRLSLNSTSLPVGADWEAITGMLIAPNSPYLYMLTMSENHGGLATVSLHPFSASYSGGPLRGENVSQRVGQSYAGGPFEPAVPAWLADGSLGLVLRGGPEDLYKTLIARFDLARGRLTTLAMVEDSLSEAAWSPDGRWLVYATESGLWGLDVTAASEYRAGPVWLSPVPVQGLDWR